MPSEKQAATDSLTDLLGIPRVVITGRQAGTVPAHVFQAAAAVAGIRHQSRTATAEAVIRAAGLDWQPNYDSRHSDSKGGGNVTEAGLWTLGRAVAVLLDRHEPLSDSEFIEQAVSTSTRGGQGRMMDPERRQKVEMAAQGWLMNIFQRKGWEVEDTHLFRPYDAIARKANEVRYLEAKGTTTRGETVIVTRGEVKWARSHPGECVLGVWSGMIFDDEGYINPDVGYTSVRMWDPDDEDLIPTEYLYRVDWSEE